MTTRLTPDICVVGGGAGGLALAAEAARGGASVVLVERDEPGGGPLRFGVALHALVAAGRHAQAMRRGARFGIADAEPEVDFRKLARHLRAAVAAAAPNRSAERLSALGVHVLREQACFADKRTVLAGENEIRARHVVIATGSAPVPPSLAGLEEVPALAPENLDSLTRRPGRLVVVGDGGGHGPAFAQAFRRLGCEVVAIEARDAFGDEDPEQAAIVRAGLRAEGVDLREHTAVMRVERRGRTGVRLRIRTQGGEEETVDGTHLLILPERAPAVEALGLDKAGIAFSSAGVTVDDRQRTTNRRVHAIGDVTGGRPGVAPAEHQATLVADALLSRKRKPGEPAAIARTLFTSPQIAAIGLGEDDAKRRHGRIRVLRWPLAENEQAQARAQTTGFIKVIADDKGRILGVSIVGEDAGEMLGAWALAMNGGLGLEDMARWMPPWPSVAEIGKRAAISYLGATTRKRGLRRLIRIPRLPG